MRRALLDEGLPKPLANLLRAHGLATDPFPNDLKQLPDGALLDHAVAEGYEVLITSDRNMPFQQTLENRYIAVVVLHSNRLPDLARIVRSITGAAEAVSIGRCVELDNRGVPSGQAVAYRSKR